MREQTAVDLETFEAVAQDDNCRRMIKQLSALLEQGQLDGFLARLAGDPNVPLPAKLQLVEIASDERFLCAIGDYLKRTAIMH